MREEKKTADRLTSYSDAVFAVIVTVMVLELRAPDQPAFSALWPLWPTAISYAVSYLFIAIIWINHHYLVQFVGPPTLRLIWINFAHLFMVSLLPFATAWIARTGLASPPSCFTQGSSYALTLPTSSSSNKSSLEQTPRNCLRVSGVSRAAGPSLCLRALRPPCWLRSSRRASPSV